MIGFRPHFLALVLCFFILQCEDSVRSPEFHLVSYGDAAFKASRERFRGEAERSGFFKSIWIFDPDTVKPLLNPETLDFMTKNKRGGGYWVWKPVIVKHVLSLIPKEDIIVYADVGCSIDISGKKRLAEYAKMLNGKKNILAFRIAHLAEKCWTKRDLSVELNSPVEFLDSGQIMATVFIIRNTEGALEFLDRWIQISNASDFKLIDDTASQSANDTCFVENRHDQSIFSLLCKGYEGCLAIGDEISPMPYSTKNGFPFIGTRIPG